MTAYLYRYLFNGHGIHGIHEKINALQEIFPCSSVDFVAKSIFLTRLNQCQCTR